MSKAEDERRRRLAEALRQNLRRRKAQARGEDSLAGTAVEGPRGGPQDPVDQAPPGPAPRSGAD